MANLDALQRETLAADSPHSQAVTGEMPDLVSGSLKLGEAVLQERSRDFLKAHGQFLTPAPVARFMARQIGPLCDGDRILDPALGSGVLACAVIERAIQERQVKDLWIDGYEIDGELLDAARRILQEAVDQAAEAGIRVHIHVQEADFLLNAFMPPQRGLFSEPEPALTDERRYQRIIANPPYFKLNREDPRAQQAFGTLAGHTNIYTLFMALSLRLLAEEGVASLIVPRSFCSGVYFARFRRQLWDASVLQAVHLFESRQETFKEASVLQENIILTFRSRPSAETIDSSTPSHIMVSTSRNGVDLERHLKSRDVPRDVFLGCQNNSLFFRLPTGELDEQILTIIDSWEGSLSRYDLAVSTGPVVPFRATEWLEPDPNEVSSQRAVPLLWMHHILPSGVMWPVKNGGKAQAIRIAAGSQPLLLPTRNYVLLRRFSAKEEARRLVAAPFLAQQFPYASIGLENHLNYIYRQKGNLDVEETVGLAALFNSALMDRYIRLISGNTQVNAAELRALPLPPLELIRALGAAVAAAQETGAPADIDALLFSILREAQHLPADFPLFRETRITMGKIQEAQEILRALGLPPAQQNEVSALTLLALAQLSEETPWGDARRQSLRIHDMLGEIRERYGREYAENTRETIRRQVIHQFEQAGLVDRNPDEPDLATNSPRTHYALSDAAIQALRHYDTDEWEAAVAAFIANRGSLLEVYKRSREQHRVPLRLPNGTEYHLSPGKHNQLQAAIIEEFGPRFASGAVVLYLGDTAQKTLIFEPSVLENLGVKLGKHEKLPDVILYDAERSWLFLIEAVTSHGPISPKRQVELERIFSECSAGLVYVSAFPDFATFKNFLSDIAWETEVWLAEMPDHLIHFNGDRFLGPHSPR